MDLDEEQRANLAHELPTDLDSSPSSQSSSIPTFYDSRRRSSGKPASRHRSNTTTEGSTTSTHLLERLVSREEEIREINAVLAITSERLEAESSRANAAERRALDYFHRLRVATESRERAEQDCARLREELKLYTLQLENAQKEIFRAQDIIDQVSSQRNEAEAEAARARTKARKLQEEKLVMLAREEGRRVGYREGLSMGRRISYDQENFDGDEFDPEHADTHFDDERNDPRSHIQLHSAASIRQQPLRPESAPPVRTYEAAPPIPIPSHISSHTPSHEHHTLSPSPPHDHEPDEPETIHPIPIPIRASPLTPTTHVIAPPDGWIPRADSRTAYIRVPPPHEFQPPNTASPGSGIVELQGGRHTPQPEPTPVPPPVRVRDYAYQPSVPAPVQQPPSLASRTSTHLSQYDLVNKRPGSSLRNEIYVGRAGSGSQHSRSGSSRNEYREQDRRRSDSIRTEAENIAEQWRADSETVSAPRNPMRSSTPSRHPRRPVQFYSRPNVTPTPLGDVEADDPRSRTLVPTEPAGSHLYPPPDDPDASNPARGGMSQIEHLRQRFRQNPRPSSGGSGSTIPNIVVESPSEPETVLSPSATTAAQPELLSPEAANRPLPSYDRNDDDDLYSQPHNGYQPQQPPPPSSGYNASATYDRAGASGSVSSVPWPAGFVPYPGPPTPVPGAGTESRSKRGPVENLKEQERSTDFYRRSSPTPVPVPAPAPAPVPNVNYRRSTPIPIPVPAPGSGSAGSGSGSILGRTAVQHGRTSSSSSQSQSGQPRSSDYDPNYLSASNYLDVGSNHNSYGGSGGGGGGYNHANNYMSTRTSGSGYRRDAPSPPPSQAGAPPRTRARTQSATASSSSYEAAPLPTGVMYPAPPVRPHTSHIQDRDRDWGRERRDSVQRDYGRDRRDSNNSAGDRDRDRRDSLRDSRDRRDSTDKNKNRYREYREGGLLANEANDDARARAQSPAELGRPISLFDSDDDR